MKLIIKLALIALIFDYAITGLLYNPPLADEENLATKRMLDFGDWLTYTLFVLILLAITAFGLLFAEERWPLAATAISLYLILIHLYGGWTWVSYYYGF